MRYFITVIFVCLSFVGFSQSGFLFRESKDNNKIELLYNKKLVTAYCYFDSTEKPVLYPIKTLSGITITRGYPIAPRSGERTDHPHQVGLWFNYESVNGIDFWNNSFAITPENKQRYGSIKLIEIVSTKAGKTEARLKTKSNWVNQAGEVFLEELTEFTFRWVKGDLVIDRICTLTAMQPEVLFKDVKDGLIALRLAHELEMPSTQEDKFIDANGIVTTVPALNNTGVTGLYVNKEGLLGDATWGKRSAWVCMNGVKGGEHISMAMFDHPKNVGYPTYWHARGYGLFAANPLGQKIFSDGKEELNYKMMKGQTVTFKYRVVVHAGAASLTTRDIEDYEESFINQSTH